MRTTGEDVNPAQAEDNAMQAAVFDELVKHHPAKLTMPELQLAMQPELRDDHPPDTVACAIQLLTSDGLVREVGEEYGLTRPAVRMAELPIT